MHLKNHSTFLEDANRVHEGKYDYTKDVYRTAIIKMAIRCPKHGIFEQTPNNHLRGAGCPTCQRRVSSPSLEWLTAMAVLDNTHIQHGGNGGEVRLAGTRLHADGYSADLNKVYEFHGNYYHGNPRKYPADLPNKRCKRTMGELYDKTRQRKAMVQQMGYQYEEIWEDEFDVAQTLLTLCDNRSSTKPCKKH